jgi:hypothetical protein
LSYQEFVANSYYFCIHNEKTSFFLSVKS